MVKIFGRQVFLRGSSLKREEGLRIYLYSSEYSLLSDYFLM
jgi:hypothetical protein